MTNHEPPSTQLKPTPLRILAIDDNETSRFILRKIVAYHFPAKTQLIFRSTAAEALAELEDIAADVILMELFLPRPAHALNFLDAYHQLANPQKIIVMTADRDEQKRARCLEYEKVSDFITTPVIPQELARAIQKATRHLGDHPGSRQKSRSNKVAPLHHS